MDRPWILEGGWWPSHAQRLLRFDCVHEGPDRCVCGVLPTYRRVLYLSVTLDQLGGLAQKLFLRVETDGSGLEPRAPRDVAALVGIG